MKETFLIIIVSNSLMSFLEKWLMEWPMVHMFDTFSMASLTGIEVYSATTSRLKGYGNSRFLSELMF